MIYDYCLKNKDPFELEIFYNYRENSTITKKRIFYNYQKERAGAQLLAMTNVWCMYIVTCQKYFRYVGLYQLAHFHEIELNVYSMSQEHALYEHNKENFDK